MLRNSLLRGLVFALVAGCLSSWVSFSVPGDYGYALLSAVVAHLVVVAPNLKRGVRASAFSACLAFTAALFVRDQLLLTALGLVILGLARSALLYPRPFLRAVLVEMFFVGSGVVAVMAWVGAGRLGLALSNWSFWLVQSAFVLSAAGVKAIPELPMDPFERAQQIAEAVLTGRPR
jgi:hypothetical protein